MEQIKYVNKIAIIFLDIYQKIASPFLGDRCRFYPSCSQYAKECFKMASFPRAVFYTFRRLLRCQPLSLGGIDEFRV